MLKLNEKSENKRNILKCGSIQYSPSGKSTTNTANSQIYINIPREDSVISLSKSCIEINFDVLHAATSNRYVNGSDIRLVNLGPIDLFSNWQVRAISGKHLEEINYAQIVSLM